MKILLDTHIAIWSIANKKMLSDDIKNLIEDNDNQVYYSMASVWEVAIKNKIRPSDMPMNEQEFVELCEQTGFESLSILPEHIYMIRTLKRPEGAKKHNDPFDRMLIAQAKAEKLSFLTHDKLLSDYNESSIVLV
jgi:PIN domain nuclease of toxin-antitoxin system